ncbi:MAG: AMP-binding protein [Eggerthellaceae bacterium]|nr:AMP-binding protein [Eggerthellaceae bacterium]
MTQQDESTIVLEVSGRIDACTHKDLQRAVADLDCAGHRLVFDFRDVSYISSAGLRVIMSAAKKVGGGNLSIVNVNDLIYDTFRIVGYDALFDIKLAQEGAATFVLSSFKEILSTYSSRSPHVEIVSHLGVSYTWEKLEACAQIVAHDLHEQGVRKGTHVGICSSNSANWIIAFFAIQKLGGIACLMNFNYSAKEIATVSLAGDITHMCYGEIATMKDEESFLADIQAAEDNQIRAFYNISSAIDFTERLGEYDSVRGLYDDKVEVDDVCVMIYTSGSTGTPKGVLLSAYNILNASQAMSDEVGVDDRDKLCLLIPLFHIFGMTAGFFCNVMKNALIVIPESTRTNALLDTIETFGCTLFHSVPTMVLAVMNNKGFSKERVATLRCVILAGAPATATQIHRMRDMFPSAHFVTAYGLSEMAPVSMTMYDDPIERVISTVGMPISNIQIAVVDPQTGVDCEPGVTGEIIVEGYNLMCSYYKVPLELQSVDDGGWLHTGDLGFFDEDGYLHLTGRAKELIIRGGENIMPSEIAEAISAFPQVADVKVQGVPHDFFGEVVGASVTMKDGATLDVDALLQFLSGRLAKYKIPAYVFQYDEFPLLSNGKVDAVALKRDMNARAAALEQGK